MKSLATFVACSGIIGLGAKACSHAVNIVHTEQMRNKTLQTQLKHQQ